MLNPWARAVRTTAAILAGLTIDDRVTLGVQVDGKLRGSVELAIDASEDTARAAAMALANVTKHLEGRVIKKFFYRPGKIISIASAPA